MIPIVSTTRINNWFIPEKAWAYDETSTELASSSIALKLTVGDQEVSFDGSAEKTAAVAAKVHTHETTDITGFDAKVQQLIANAGTTHTHTNKTVLDGITAE